MEMQFFILGHVILLAIVWGFGLVASILHYVAYQNYVDVNDENKVDVDIYKAVAYAFIMFEIIYWILYWIFV